MLWPCEVEERQKPQTARKSHCLQLFGEPRKDNIVNDANMSTGDCCIKILGTET